MPSPRSITSLLKAAAAVHGGSQKASPMPTAMIPVQSLKLHPANVRQAIETIELVRAAVRGESPADAQVLLDGQHRLEAYLQAIQHPES
jgi:hypothetical protein